jgi:hypothetical protein
MRRERTEPLSPDIKSLLANDRLDFPQSQDLRRRALLRARAAMQGAAASGRARPRFAGLRWTAAAAALFIAATLFAAVIKTRRNATADRPLESPLATAPTTLTPLVAPRSPSQKRASEMDIRAEAPPTNAAHGARRARTVAEDYAIERMILQPARAALAAGDVSSALAAIGEHARRFQAGQLTEEREALRVEALLHAHRTDEARTAAADFREQFPQSVLRSFVSDALRAAP